MIKHDKTCRAHRVAGRSYRANDTFNVIIYPVYSIKGLSHNLVFKVFVFEEAPTAPPRQVAPTDRGTLRAYDVGSGGEITAHADTLSEGPEVAADVWSPGGCTRLLKSV